MQTGAIVLLSLMASVKFLVAPPVGFAAGLSFLTVVTFQFVGGVLGVIAFYYLFHWLLERGRHKMVEKRNAAIAAGETPKRMFTKRNRAIVRYKHKLGFYGVVFIALPFASLPIEGLICAKFFRHERLLIPLLIVSTAFWSFLLSAFYKFFFDGIKAYFL